MPPRLTPTAPARGAGAPAGPAAPPEPSPRIPALSPQVLAAFAVFLVLEALLIVALVRRVEGPAPVAAADFSQQEYVDLQSATVPVHSSKAGLDVHINIRVEASILVTGSGGDRAKARDAVRLNGPKIADEIARTVGTMTAEQAVDPGNRERLKDRLRIALNQAVFREELAREVVFRYYGP